jgi:hypothetical protein
VGHQNVVACAQRQVVGFKKSAVRRALLAAASDALAVEKQLVALIGSDMSADRDIPIERET